MAKVTKWSNVAIAMQSALGDAITATAISKAEEAVVTATNTLQAGDWVVSDVLGMWQIHDRMFRVKSATASSFVLEGENTTEFDDFSSGTFRKVTLGVSITTATSVSPGGGGFDFIDTTTIHGNARTQIPGLPAATTYSFENQWDVSDSGLKAMKQASDAQVKRAFLFRFGNGGQIMAFNGYVGANLAPGGAAQGLVTCQTVITMNGSPTYYAS